MKIKTKKLAKLNGLKYVLCALAICIYVTFFGVTTFGQTGLTEGSSSLKEGATPISKEEVNTVEDSGKGATSGKQHIFPAYECTWYAANTYYSRTGQPITFGGNAGTWYTNAKNAGYQVSTSTTDITRNAILVFNVGKYGHVVIVESANFYTGTISLSESNWIPKKIGTRTIKFSDLKRLGFIGIILPPNSGGITQRRYA